MVSLDKMEIFKSKIKKLDNLKSIGEFIDLLAFYHLNKCVFKDWKLLIYRQNYSNLYFILSQF